MTPAEMEELIRAEWKRQGIPTDYMDGGTRTVTAWERAAFSAGVRFWRHRTLTPGAKRRLAKVQP